PAPSPAARSRRSPRRSKIEMPCARAGKITTRIRKFPVNNGFRRILTNLDRPSGGDIFFTQHRTVCCDRRRKNGGKMKSKVLIVLSVVCLFVNVFSSIALSQEPLPPPSSQGTRSPAARAAEAEARKNMPKTYDKHDLSGIWY